MNRLEYLSQFSNAVLSPELNCDPNNMLRAKSAGKAMFENLAVTQVGQEEKEFRKMWCKEQLGLIGEFGAVLGGGV